MAKTVEDLEKSREFRQNVILKYGFVPTSVWEADYSVGKDVMTYGKTQAELVEEKQKQEDYDPSLMKAFSSSGRSVRGKNEDEQALSIFPPDIAMKIVKFYSEENDTVLDPFAGHNSRMQVTHQLRRNYIGYDISEKFMKFNEEVKNQLLGLSQQQALFIEKNTILLNKQSSTKLNEPDNSIDMIFTSPPYYNIEFYGDEPEQLGKCKTYEDFLNEMTKVVTECHRTLKNDKYCIFNINDFRDKGKYYAYHSDIIDIYKKVGFKIWDVIILKWSCSIGACFASQVEERKITAKAHEYIIVGKK